MNSTQMLRRMISRTPLPKIAIRSTSGVRVVLYHDIGEPNDFTFGIGVSTSAALFEAHLDLLSNHYEFVSIKDVIEGTLPDRPLLITFDDAYKSVLDTASPITQRLGIKPLFFVSTGPVFGGEVVLDNLISFAQKNAPEELHSIFGTPLGTSAAAIISSILPKKTALERRRYRDRLASALGATPEEWGCRSGLYLDQGDLLELKERGFDLGTHTSTHVHLRGLLPSEYEEELITPSLLIEGLTGERPGSFSLPFGSRNDLKRQAMDALRSAGIRRSFLVEGMSNPAGPCNVMCRNSVGRMDERDLLAEIEVISRLKTRSIRELP